LNLSIEVIFTHLNCFTNKVISTKLGYSKVIAIHQPQNSITAAAAHWSNVEKKLELCSFIP